MIQQSTYLQNSVAVNFLKVGTIGQEILKGLAFGGTALLVSLAYIVVFTVSALLVAYACQTLNLTGMRTGAAILGIISCCIGITTSIYLLLKKDTKGLVCLAFASSAIEGALLSISLVA